MSDQKRKALLGKLRTAAYGAAVVVALVILGAVFGLWPGDGDSGPSRSQLNFPAGGPAEFLYLDRGRVVAYLAQVEGGTIAKEQLSSKHSDSAETKLTLKEIAEFGASTTEEDSLAREVTPTTAAEYFELLFDLEHEPGLEDEPEGVDTVSLGHFHKDVEDLTEGQFVTFRTHGLRAPIYLNPYLATRQRTTMETLFPPPARATVGPARAHRQRKRALHFRSRLGKNPRVVFELRPLEPKEVTAIRKRQRAERKARASAAAGSGGTTATSTEPAPGGLSSAGSPPIPEASPPPTAAHRRANTCKKARRQRNELKRLRKPTAEQQAERHHVVYLMPMDARLLTRERSLIKFGGGEFTVVGKVVRIFPENGDVQSPAYVDSPTRETWEQPLAHAPLKLLCGTDSKCKKLSHKYPKATQAEIRESRCNDLEALREQTEIPRRGAVILPIAVYK
jgi:hypothetical protein